ncbi:uncharacterized protein BDZ99DRAFT_501615 [Mytilinidion resinicola]|uniref:Clr5 domain-containing protein n=1 Tax=Mytilinidion resinicola TaxID=574789 RepID=A0A6A6YBM8_9PEZI|nr:uncharacterized protein BDZ99DRAFT_501615 [Mytilinidion resinicola]KAF2806100.1 hypothetical protein BDZ99DRAFT_501615 [Mytilinidion resinicola]
MSPRALAHPPFTSHPAHLSAVASQACYAIQTNMAIPFPCSSTKDLDAWMDEIISLNSEHKLQDTMEIMEREYQFRATEKMYKTKLAQWRKQGKLPPKRVSGRSQKAMLRIEKEHLDATGRGTSFRYRGHPIPPEKYRRYEKRHALSQNESRSRSASRTPSYISYNSHSIAEQNATTASESNPMEQYLLPAKQPLHYFADSFAQLTSIESLTEYEDVKILTEKDANNLPSPSQAFGINFSHRNSFDVPSSPFSDVTSLSPTSSFISITERELSPFVDDESTPTPKALSTPIDLGRLERLTIHHDRSDNGGKAVLAVPGVDSADEIKIIDTTSERTSSRAVTLSVNSLPLFPTDLDSCHWRALSSALRRLELYDENVLFKAHVSRIISVMWNLFGVYMHGSFLERKQKMALILFGNIFSFIGRGFYEHDHLVVQVCYESVCRAFRSLDTLPCDDLPPETSPESITRQVDGIWADARKLSQHCWWDELLKQPT